MCGSRSVSRNSFSFLWILVCSRFIISKVLGIFLHVYDSLYSSETIKVSSHSIFSLFFPSLLYGVRFGFQDIFFHCKKFKLMAEDLGFCSNSVRFLHFYAFLFKIPLRISFIPLVKLHSIAHTCSNLVNRRSFLWNCCSLELHYSV